MITYNGNDLEAAHKDADRFIALTSSYLSVPKRVYNDDTGVVSLFWDTPSFYADIEFKGDGHFDLFSREYVAPFGHPIDSTVDNVALEYAMFTWCSEHLKPLFKGV